MRVWSGSIRWLLVTAGLLGGMAVLMASPSAEDGDAAADAGMEMAGMEMASGILHGTFDFSEEIGANIRSGVTLFGVNQQQALQGYNSVVALTLEARYGISPASKVTSTGPAFLTAANLDTAPTRFIVDPDRELTFIAVQHARCAWDSFWCTVEEGIAQAAADTGVEVTVLGPDSFDLNRVAELIDQAVAAQPDGILLTYTDSRFKAPVQRALDAGIPVVAYNAGRGPELDEVDYLTYLGQDEYLGGYEGGRRLVAAAGGGSHLGVCINQAVGHVGLDARCQGFVDALSEAGIGVAGSSGVLAVSDDAASSQQTISDFYAANPAVDIFLTLGPNGATPFYGFVEQEGMMDADYVHGTFDLNQEIARNIRSGRTEFGIDQQPFLQGYGAVTILYLNHRFRAVPPTSVTPTGPGFVTRANIDVLPTSVDQYRAQRNQSVDLIAVQHARCDWDSWWCTMRDTMTMAAANLGVNLQILAPDAFDVNEVARLVDQARADQPDGMAITITNADILRDSVKRVLADGIPVVGFNAGDGPDSDRIPYGTYIGQREYDGGYAGGKFLAQAAPAGSKGVCVNHQVGHIGLDARCSGFADAMREAGIALAGSNGVLSISDDVAASAQVISDFYAGNPDTNIFFTLGPNSATPFYDFLESEGLN